MYKQIINDLNEIIENNKTSQNVYNTYAFAKTAIQNKEVILEINPKINSELDYKMANSILGGAYFRYIKSGIVNLAFGQKYLDTYKKNSSIHYTILMHEFKHINDYFLNKNYFFNSNKKDRFQYELNAINIEVEFIKHYLLGKLDLSKCEKYILESYEKDNLDSWTILNRKESADIFLILINLEKEYNNKIKIKDELINELNQIADRLLIKSDQFLNLHDVYNSNEKTFSQFGHYIRIKTFDKYLQYIFRNDSEMKEQILTNNEFEAKHDMMIYLLSEHDHVNKIYSSSLENYIEDNFFNG